jgi:ubiquinone/menaquinone biosynthesis C-methylase UbiE
MSAFDVFGHMELSGWADAKRASAYVDLFAAASDQAIPDLLAAIEATPSMRILDLCCGQGNVTEALVGLGCFVVAVDFSPAMLSLAKQRVPVAEWVEADAQDLPFDAGAFDAVVSNLGICHVPDQPQALSEVRRVLRPGGRFGMTVWCGPDTSPAFETLYGAVRAHGHPDLSIPEAPDFHQFAHRATAEALLSAAGFSDVDVCAVDCFWDLSSPSELAAIYENGTVRASALLNGQPAANLAAIRSAMEAAVRERFRHEECWRVPVPAALAKARASAD